MPHFSRGVTGLKVSGFGFQDWNFPFADTRNPTPETLKSCCSPEKKEYIM
jgi:hypothetical protein